MRMEIEIAPRFDYGRAQHRVVEDGTAIRFASDELVLQLTTEVPLTVQQGSPPDRSSSSAETWSPCFSMCSFWYVEALTRAGCLEDARLAFEKMLTYANPVGLYAEEVSVSGEQLGNFPQAFTHLSLISAALNLDRALG
jgi:hypothetical protein